MVIGDRTKMRQTSIISKTNQAIITQYITFDDGKRLDSAFAGRQITTERSKLSSDAWVVLNAAGRAHFTRGFINYSLMFCSTRMILGIYLKGWGFGPTK